MASFYDQYAPIAFNAAQNAGIDPNVFVAQIGAESSFNPNALSSAGAEGIAQFMPGTAQQYGVDPWNPTSALQGSANYMKSLLGRFGGNYTAALAAYNEGAAKVSINSDGSVNAFSGSLNYAKSILAKAGNPSSWSGYISTAASVAACATGDVLACGQAANGLGTGSGQSWLDELKSWIIQSSFFQRLALAFLGLIFVIAGLYLYKPAVINNAVKGAAIVGG